VIEEEEDKEGTRSRMVLLLHWIEKKTKMILLP
jgi:hypothetical protein